MVHYVVWRGDELAQVALRVAIGIAGAVVLFGLYWNNSDDQFFFQLSAAVGMLTAAVPPWHSRVPKVALMVSLTVLAWNLFDTTTRCVLYPREERIQLLGTALDGADLVILPGQEEVDHLLYFVDKTTTGERLSLTHLMARYEANEGLEVLGSRVEEVISGGGRVDVVGVFDSNLGAQPWRALSAAGYGADRIRDLFGRYDIDVRQVGPFTVGTISTAAGG
jgi:hypothetical protein